jgi:hypothetical protein
MARYDASSYGRFMGLDQGEPIALWPTTLNRYAYTGDDPINFKDSTGNNMSPCGDDEIGPCGGGGAGDLFTFGFDASGNPWDSLYAPPSWVAVPLGTFEQNVQNSRDAATVNGLIPAAQQTGDWSAVNAALAYNPNVSLTMTCGQSQVFQIA